MLLLPFRHSREGSYFGRDVGLLLHLPHSLSRAHAAFWKSFDLAASLEFMLFPHWQPTLFLVRMLLSDVMLACCCIFPTLFLVRMLLSDEFRPGCLPGVDAIPPLAAAISRRVFNSEPLMGLS